MTFRLAVLKKSSVLDPLCQAERMKAACTVHKVCIGDTRHIRDMKDSKYAMVRNSWRAKQNFFFAGATVTIYYNERQATEAAANTM